MEELCVLTAMAAGSVLALVAADIVGVLLGLGWGHYSKKAAATRRSKVTDDV
ncbi:MAG TPA: hypothetical protein VFP12_06245 [Allosphingosinicella sp.]|nr:hypothetical protein [Allosphingosinicella sp.]